MRDAREHDPPRRITWDIITREAKKLIANKFQLLNPMKVFYSTSFMTACRFCISRTGHPALSEYELRDFARYMRENRLEAIELDLSEDEEENPNLQVIQLGKIIQKRIDILELRCDEFLLRSVFMKNYDISHEVLTMTKIL